VEQAGNQVKNKAEPGRQNPGAERKGNKTMKVYVNNHGWIMGVQSKDGNVIGLRFTSQRAGAKPFHGDWLVDEEARDVLYFIENTMQCAYFKHMV
jgi:hypothetical protein